MYSPELMKKGVDDAWLARIGDAPDAQEMTLGPVMDC